MKPYDNKHLVIIGAGLLQVPAIKIANELGLKTIVTDYNENASGMKIADYPIVMSIRDIDGTVRILKEFNKKKKIDGVITIGTDASMTVAAVAGALNLPGIKFENAEAASNKYKMRLRLKEHGVPIPAFYKCWNYDDLINISKKISYPFVIKPVDNMGARGVMKVENEAMLEMAFDNAKSGSPSGELIVEEYMEGHELSIDAIVFNNEIRITGIADRIIEREPYFIELGHVMPSIQPQEILDDAVDVFKKAIKAIGIDIGAAKGDIKVTKKGAKIVEIAARLSGGFMSAFTYPYSSGVNLIRIAIDIAIGMKPQPQLFIPTKNRVSIEKGIIPQPGIIREISGINDALAIPGVMDVFLRVDIGDEIIDPKSNVEKAGNIIVVKDTMEEAWETVKKAEECIKIITKEDKVLTWENICHNAREKFNRTCFVCKTCDGIECKGKIPGVGGIGNGNAFIRNYQDLGKILIRTKNIHNVKNTDTSCEILGLKLDLPLIAAPITGCDLNMGGGISEFEYDLNLLQGCKDAGIIGFVGDGAQPDLYKTGVEAIKKTGGHGGIIFKPRVEQKDIIKRLNAAAEAGVCFVGIDIDASNFLTMKLTDQKVSSKSLDEIIELVKSVKMPFFLKGIMNPEDAEFAVQSGASAIVVSNHGGRITDNHPSSISVLKDIADIVKGRISILFDGGVRTGEDIFKAISLGADAVMVGRPFSIAVIGGERKGVTVLVKQFKEQFERIMLLTGSKTVKDIKSDCLLYPDFLINNYIKNGMTF